MTEKSDLIAAAERLAKSVSFDMNGEMIGARYVGGHGGLISNETLRAADEIRRLCHRLKEPSP